MMSTMGSRDCRSSEEASEQSGIGRCGARGAKGRGQEECGAAKGRYGTQSREAGHERGPAPRQPSPETDR